MSAHAAGLRPPERLRWVELTTATDVNELHLMAAARRRAPRVRPVPMPEIATAA